MKTSARICGTLLACTYFWFYFIHYEEWHLIDNVNLIFHEAGHTIFFFLGRFVHMLAGTGLQLAIPLFISVYFFLTGQRLSGALCLLWVGQNLLNVSVYAGDAQVMQMDLLGGDYVTHDWNYLLGVTGLLGRTTEIAHAIYSLGFITMLSGTALSIYHASK